MLEQCCDLHALDSGLGSERCIIHTPTQMARVRRLEAGCARRAGHLFPVGFQETIFSCSMALVVEALYCRQRPGGGAPAGTELRGQRVTSMSPRNKGPRTLPAEERWRVIDRSRNLLAASSATSTRNVITASCALSAVCGPRPPGPCCGQWSHPPATSMRMWSMASSALLSELEIPCGTRMGPPACSSEAE